jgi:hypothetical protein
MAPQITIFRAMVLCTTSFSVPLFYERDEIPRCLREATGYAALKRIPYIN